MEINAGEIYRSLKAIEDFKLASINMLGKNPGQAVGLLLIQRIAHTNGEDPRPSQLSELAGVMPATITSMLRKLEERGLIRREPSQKDRREVIIRLTESGQKLCDEVAVRIMERFQQLSDYAGEESLYQFFEFSRRVEEFNKME